MQIRLSFRTLLPVPKPAVSVKPTDQLVWSHDTLSRGTVGEALQRVPGVYGLDRRDTAAAATNTQ